MQTISQTYVINAPVDKVWDALTNPETITKWGAGPAEMQEQVGSQFKLWGGEIHGTNIQIIPQQRIMQDWYGGEWPEPSKVTFTLTPQGEQTRVDLYQENIPDDEVDSIYDGWQDYYMGPLQELLETGNVTIEE